MINQEIVKPMKKLLSGLALSFIAALFVSQSALAQQDDYVAGAHYELLSEFQPVQTGDKIEVVEMFWYRCPHCYRLEPYIIKWLKNIPENAEYVAIPAILNQNWVFHGRAYYTFEALGIVDELHGKFFDALHKDRQQLNTTEQLADWATQFGVDEEKFISTFDSFAVNNKINFANIMGRKYGISGVPSIIVDGKFRTNVSMAGSHDELFNVINFLIKKAEEERQS
jgi:thiol:disulfide interchange protein DsbA